MKNKSFTNSFNNAFSGVLATIKNERNVRIHLSVANLIVIFAYFYGITNVEWAVLFSAISCVIGAELINTAIENAVDTSTNEICETARLAKDSAAGAVLLFAIASIIVGFMLFFDIEKIYATLSYIFSNLWILTGCLTVGILDIIFIVFGGNKNV